MNQPVNPDVAAIAAKAMGVEPQADPAPAPAAPNPAPAEPGPTPTEQAVSQSAPADPSKTEAFVFEVPDKDGKKVPVTADQYFGMKDRYAKLNYEHAQLKPVIDLAKNIMAKHQIDGKTTADALLKLANQKVTNKPEKIKSPEQEASSDALAQWEKENGVDATPLREASGMQQALAQQIQQQNEIIKQLLSRQANVAGQAQQAVNEAGAREDNAMARTFANNMGMIQQRFGFDEAKFNEFVDYYKQRGYVEEDLIDPSMAMRVGGDFFNSNNAPRMQQLQAQAERRLAATGSLGPTPGTGNQPTSQSQGESDIDRIAAKTLAARNPSL